MDLKNIEKSFKVIASSSKTFLFPVNKQFVELQKNFIFSWNISHFIVDKILLIKYLKKKITLENSILNH